MIKKFIVIFLMTVLTGALLSGCIDKTKEKDSSTTAGAVSGSHEFEGTIRVSGAFALYPMMLKWGEEYKKLHPKVEFDIQAGGAGKGMTDALGGLVDIGMVSRAITPAEEENGAYWISITKDAVVPTVNENNPVIAQIKANGIKREVFDKIYINETIRTWGQATGTSAADKINVYTRSDAAGAPETWALYLGMNKQEKLKGVGLNGDPGVAQAVREDRLGIGYNNIGFAYDANTKKPIEGLEIIPIDLNGNGKIDPEENFYGTLDEIVEAIGTGKYPSPPARSLNLVTRGKPKDIVNDFIKWTLTDGQKYIPEQGFIVLPQSIIADGLKKVE